MNAYEKNKIKNLLPEELEIAVSQMALPEYRYRQISDWIFTKKIKSFDEMSNVPIKARNLLSDEFQIDTVKIKKIESSSDGTKKFCFELDDGLLVESVLIPSDELLTLCISSQSGCSLGCKFCATGGIGFNRNLTCGEIIDQFIFVSRELPPGVNIKNIVFMGMGEPLLNFKEVKKALILLTSENAIGFSPSKITVSTSGIYSRLEEFGKLKLAELAISLNAADNKKRSSIMPVNNKYPLNALIKKCKEYPLNPREKITFEYVLLSGFNDTPQDTENIKKLLSGIKCKINLIPFNEFEGCGFKSPGRQDILKFQAILRNFGFDVLIRNSRGQDISAACGCLAARSAKNP
ncbi:MAG TPA: 23S rRNA (adenine(2503)-C(2))-methyltransferase RlmN [bacterium]|nr:23S rRNA (adenine(2503)-C(2))-methyltransferase RlmN [bacterium]